MTRLLAIDVGGSGGNCVLVDSARGPLRHAYHAWRHAVAPGTGGLGFDLDLPGIWRHLVRGCREILAGEAPAAIAVTGMRFTTVVLDGERRTLLANPNRDARATPQGLALAAEHGEALGRCTGHWPIPIFGAARLLGLAEREPAAWRRAAHVLGLADWIAWRLCGEVATDPTQAAGSGLFDLAAGDWAWEWIDALGLPRRLFPAILEPGTRLGALTPEAASELGVAPGVPLVMAAADTQCGLVGLGALAPGDRGLVAGSSAPVQRVVATPQVDADARLWSERHAAPGAWVLESNAGPLGEAVSWFGSLLFAGCEEPAERLFAEAALGEPGAGGVLSSAGSQVMDARELRIPIGELTLSHLCADTGEAGRPNVARALIEGMAYAVRANLEQIGEVAGDDALAAKPPLRVGGGLARSELWCRILADVTGAPVWAGAGFHASGLGAAICAGAGVGVFADLADGASRLCGELRVHEPEAGAAAAYASGFATWQGLRRARSGGEDLALMNALPAVLRAGAGGRAGDAAPSRRTRILATAELDAEGLAGLGALGELEHAPFRSAKRLLCGPELVAALRGVEVFITEVDVVDAESLRALPGLRVVAACRGDAVNVDVEACTALGIPVLHAPGRNAEAVADLTLAFLLALARKLPSALAFLRDPGVEAGDVGRQGQAFGALQGRELGGRTVGLIGLGAVGRAVARRLRAFGARVLAHDPVLPRAAAVRAGARPVGLDELLAASDYVSLHAAVTAETRGLIGAAELARMKPGACLVNTARAALLDEDALVAALRSGHLGGAGLDVFSVEPPGADHPLLRLDGVLGTPHIGGNTADVARHQGRAIAADLARLLRGETPRHVLNPTALEHFDLDAPRHEPEAAAWQRLLERPPPAPSDLRAESATGSASRADAAAPPAATPDAPAALVEAMEALLADFLARAEGDEALEHFAKGKDVTLHFVLRDLGPQFHLRLHEGRIEAGLGAPETPAEVELRLRAALLDGMFTGTADPMQAAMEGDLSFRGDTVKAMTLQHIRGDLERLYGEARAARGAPEGLAELPDPARASRPAPVAGDDDPRRELIRVLQDLHAQQLVTATGGNLSVRMPEREAVWITPSALFKGDLQPESLVEIDLAGRSLDPNGRSPSSEAAMHCAIYRARPEVRAVVHAHAPHATILANAELAFLPISTEAAFFGDIPRLGFVMPGTDDLAEAAARAMGDGWAVLLQNHGLLVAGRSLRRAADMAEIIDRSSQIILGCHAVGREPPTLPHDVVERLRSLGDLVA